MAVNCQLLKEILETWAMKYITVWYLNECMSFFLVAPKCSIYITYPLIHCLSLRTTITPNPSVEGTVLSYLKTTITFQEIGAIRSQCYSSEGSEELNGHHHKEFC